MSSINEPLSYTIPIGDGVRLAQNRAEPPPWLMTPLPFTPEKIVTMEFLWIGIGGFLGANARYYLGQEVGQRMGVYFPYGTMIVNITGAFLIGAILTLLTDKIIADPLWRQLIVIGFLGGFTTFSSYTYESLGLLQDGRWSSAVFYMLGSNMLGLVACLAGVVLARSVNI